MTLESDEYYQINGTKKVLYWDGSIWWLPRKDVNGRLGYYISKLEKQPKVRTAIKIKTGL